MGPRYPFRRLPQLVVWLGAGMALCPALCSQETAGLALPDSPGALATAHDGDAPQQRGSDGTVHDPSGAMIPGAALTLTGTRLRATYTTHAREDGSFTLPSLPPGTYTLTVSAPGFATYTATVQVTAAGPPAELTGITLDPTVQAEVTVSASQQELATAEVHLEETQRIAGAIPNFFVTYDWHAAPLTPRQKFHLATKTVIDPVSILLNGAFAGFEQAENEFPGYGQGAAGYGKRFGAENADFAIGTYLGGAVFPSLFHQDPRYFYMGTGTIRHRFLYALSTAVICRGDNGKWQFSYAGILGDLSAGAISNIYYPASDRHGAALTFYNGLLAMAIDGADNVVQEFLLPHLTPHRPHYDNQAPQDTPPTP